MFNGNKLRYLRKNKNWLQSDVAEKLNLSTSTIGMYEQCRNKPDDETLVKIAKLFNVSVDYLLDNDEINSFVEHQEENKELLRDVADSLDDPVARAIYSKTSKIKNERDRKMVLNVLKSFEEEIDNNS